jgi:branched-chain amino acid transport system substrate-binding protein
MKRALHRGRGVMKHHGISVTAIVISLFFSISFSVPAVAKTETASQGSEESSSPVLIGIPHNEKFPFAAMMKNSFEMALTVINGKGGIKGRPLKLVYADDQGKPDVGEKVIKKLIKEENVAMLVGGYSSRNTVYMAGMAEKLDRPFLITTAADDRITQRKWKNVYRLNPPASGYTQGLENFFLQKVQPKSIGIVYENSPFGTGGALRMMWFCREQGIEITKIIPYHRERVKKEYYQRILTPLKEESPDVIYMISYLNDAVALVQIIREMDIPSLLCGGAGGFTHPKFITMAGEAGNRVLTATLWFQEIPYSGIEEYYNDYVKRAGTEPDYHGAEAYSALLVAADALRKAESLSPGSIRDALDKTDITTPFGPIRFSSYEKFERQNSLPTQVLQVINGQFECVWPEKLSTSDFAPPAYWRASEGR